MLRLWILKLQQWPLKIRYWYQRWTWSIPNSGFCSIPFLYGLLGLASVTTTYTPCDQLQTFRGGKTDSPEYCVLMRILRPLAPTPRTVLNMNDARHVIAQSEDFTRFRCSFGKFSSFTTHPSTHINTSQTLSPGQVKKVTSIVSSTRTLQGYTKL